MLVVGLLTGDELILIIVGVVGLVLSLLYVFAWAPHRGGVVRDRVVERDPHHEPPRTGSVGGLAPGPARGEGSRLPR
jgi:hypothetical protein